MKGGEGKRAYLLPLSRFMPDAWAARVFENAQAVFCFSQPHITHGKPKQPRLRFSAGFDLLAKQRNSFAKITTMECQPSFFIIVEIGLRSFVETPNFLIGIKAHF